MIIEGVDLGKTDLNKVQYDQDAIYEKLEQRYEFKQLDAIVEMNKEKGYIIGKRDIREDEFWIKGHIPGRPLLPGVMMVEASCQLTQFFFYSMVDRDKDDFLALAGLNNIKFKRFIVPGDKLYLFASVKSVKLKAARSKNYIVTHDQKLVMSGEFTGVILPHP